MLHLQSMPTVNSIFIFVFCTPASYERPMALMSTGFFVEANGFMVPGLTVEHDTLYS
jgi:hypothetical protein